jgi:hypothetical protein
MVGGDPEGVGLMPELEQVVEAGIETHVPLACV